MYQFLIIAYLFTWNGAIPLSVKGLDAWEEHSGLPLVVQLPFLPRQLKKTRCCLSRFLLMILFFSVLVRLFSVPTFVGLYVLGEGSPVKGRSIFRDLEFRAFSLTTS